jgi:hypothetical protein
MEKLYNTICHFVGLRLLTLGSQLVGMRIVSIYNDESNQHVLAIHMAVNESHLNSSVRTYVEVLDGGYEH